MGAFRSNYAWRLNIMSYEWIFHVRIGIRQFKLDIDEFVERKIQFNERRVEFRDFN